MTVKQMHHVGVVVDDLAAAVEFFAELGLEPGGEGSVGGPTVDRIVGLEGVRCDVAFMETPDGHGRIELTKFNSPPSQDAGRDAPANAVGLRHVCFEVDDVEDVLARLRARGGELVGELEQYEQSYRLCYVRGPGGIIVELAQKLG